jgi:hypothetical protein
MKTKVKEVSKVNKSNKANKVVLSKEAKKEALRVKREANPQFSHLVSKAHKKEVEAFKLDFKANLIEAKRRSDLLVVGSFNKYENEKQLKECKTFINKVLKSEELTSLFIQAVRVNKNGSFSPFYFAQLVQKVVSIVNNKKGFDYVTALNRVIVQKSKNK